MTSGFPSSLSICIPTYKRPSGAIAAAESVLSQITDFEPMLVKVLIAEDCGDRGDFEQIAMALGSSPHVHLTRNDRNYGMSKNILSMFLGQSSEYCMILTDDDVLLTGSGKYIASLIHQRSFGVFFGPRQCVLEDGVIKTNATDLGHDSRRIQPNPFNFGRISPNFFILSGLIVDPLAIDYDLWSRHLENAFFPILFGYSGFKRKSCFYYSEPIVKHTVLNVCHWERWGKTKLERELRLAQDFFHALRLIQNDQKTCFDIIVCMFGSLPSRSVHFLHCLVVPLLSSHRRTRLSAVSYIVPYLRVYFSAYQNLIALIWVPFVAFTALSKKILLAMTT
jgi:glycosyltransferase involved in cell wall biosynthesis